MRDRLLELQQRVKEAELSKEENSHVDPSSQGEEVVIMQQAIIFEKEPIVESILNDVQRIQDEINELEEDITKFSQQQKTLVSSMRRFSVIKKENNITRDIKIRAEHIHKRLEAMSKDVKQTGADNGLTSTVTRIQHTQHAMLFKQFQKVMSQYNGTLVGKQEKCKQFIIRQLEVAGKEVGEEEVDEMMVQGKWEVFNENIINEVKITKSQLSEIEQRHKELMNLESQMRDLRELFLEIYMQVELHGDQVNNIEANVSHTQDYIQQSNEKFKLAVRYKKKHPCKVMCCCCFPCCK
ncbi:STX19 protein, partial [Polyodon spathula]|nr:syntaxin-19-like [Polyodon spathula]XP_041128255.1 syntaxin-19-like [Polyodon spathula]MBN3285260.1 STX19 protein [Polyodon spathula]